MRILIDECVDERLRHSFPEHACVTARFAALSGFKNGQLLDAAENARFEVLITVDQNMPSQQNLRGRRVAILILRAATNRLQDLFTLVPAAKTALEALAPGAVVTIQ